MATIPLLSPLDPAQVDILQIPKISYDVSPLIEGHFRTYDFGRRVAFTVYLKYFGATVRHAKSIDAYYHDKYWKENDSFAKLAEGVIYDPIELVINLDQGNYDHCKSDKWRITFLWECSNCLHQIEYSTTDEKNIDFLSGECGFCSDEFNIRIITPYGGSGDEFYYINR